MGDVFLTGIEDFGLRGGSLNLGDVSRLDGIAKDDAHFAGRTGGGGGGAMRIRNCGVFYDAISIVAAIAPVWPVASERRHG